MHCAEDVWMKICQLVRTRVSVEMILVWIALIMRNSTTALIVRNSNSNMRVWLSSRSRVWLGCCAVRANCTYHRHSHHRHPLLPPQHYVAAWGSPYFQRFQFMIKMKMEEAKLSADNKEKEEELIWIIVQDLLDKNLSWPIIILPEACHIQ